MDKATIIRLAEKLADRVGGAGPRVVGILMMDDDGSVAVTVDADIEVDVLQLGVRAQARRTKIVAEKPLGDIVAETEEELDRGRRP